MSKLAIASIALVGILAAAAGVAWAGKTKSAEPTTVSAPVRDDTVTKSEDEWKAELSAEEFYVLRKKGTERAFTGKYWDDKKPGVYACAGCGLELFHSEHKFKSGTGWPSYYKPVAEDRVAEHSDYAFGMVRTEVVCARCGGHLGHVFPDGPKPTGLRYCINGTALDKKPNSTPAN